MRAVADAAGGGDPAARAALERYAATIAAPLALTTAPEIIVVGGALARAGQHVVRPLQDALDTELGRELPGDHADLVRPRVRATPLAERVVALGGVALARTVVERAMFGP